MIQINDNKWIAEEGKVIIRLSDSAIIGEFISLGTLPETDIIDNIDNYGEIEMPNEYKEYLDI